MAEFVEGVDYSVAQGSGWKFTTSKNPSERFIEVHTSSKQHHRSFLSKNARKVQRDTDYSNIVEF